MQNLFDYKDESLWPQPQKYPDITLYADQAVLLVQYITKYCRRELGFEYKW